MLLHPWDFPGKSTGVGCHFLLQRIFPTQGSNPGLPHCRQMLYRLSYQFQDDFITYRKTFLLRKMKIPLISYYTKNILIFLTEPLSTRYNMIISITFLILVLQFGLPLNKHLSTTPYGSGTVGCWGTKETPSKVSSRNLFPRTKNRVVSEMDKWVKGEIFKDNSFICYFTDAVPVPSEKSPSLQTNVSLDKNSDSTITKTITGNPLQMPLEKQPAAKSCDTLTTLSAHWPASQEEFIGPHLRTSKSDSTFRNQASVETLYVSPSFTAFDPTKEAVISKGHQKATQSSLVPMEDENLKTLASWVSTASEGAFSYSTLSVSSPDSASPEKSVHPLPPVLAGPSFWTLSRQESSSASVKNIDKTASIHHSFAPRSPLSFNEKENDHLNLLEILPDNSDSAKKKTSSISSSNWVAFSTQNVDHFTSMSCSSSQATKDLSREPEADNSTNVLLGEVKNAIVTLHEDLSMVIRELNVISSRLVSMSGSSPQISKSLQFPQYSEADSDQV
ncbi:hypothetical protein FD755_003197 [Muntiacus reevesi]|uniref:ENTH domain-containing protein n=1 Tax=Muntiacus reevesi TaxID=9886 RepID=A0A5J5N697_MUNRE|nr:hypothetical protein FD755_003197 [Muntiacus reevesi]